jgi:sn-glycerol 3-phosphate transport system ATP-binding protein
MDEPLSNLDAQLRGEMRHEIRTLQQKLGITMAYVTHDQTEAMTMADQVVLLRDGHIEQDGAPHVLYARPATLFAARFIGTPPMNTLVLADGGAGAVIRGTDGPPLLRHPGAGLVLGVRPEAVVLDAERGLHGRVESVEFLGADSLVTCALGSERLVARVPGRAETPPGTGVRLAWRAEDVHIFGAADGARRDDLAPLAIAGKQPLEIAI